MSDRVVEFRVGVMVLATAIIAGILVVLFGDLPSLISPPPRPRPPSSPAVPAPPGAP
jgi:ABC-type transporter Mla subunit MlaD